jgi:excinuclease ABC subunit C
VTLEQFKKKMGKIPDTPGVYFFLGKHKQVLYIGKATSLRDRMRSYFSKDLLETRSPLIYDMVNKAASIDWRQTDSVLEALLLEAALIRSHKPPHNTDLKDDKSFNYVVITKEDYPRLLIVRGRELTLKQPWEAAYIFGPFPHGLQLREAMKLIRKIFPFRENCTPAEVLIKQGKKPKACFNEHLGLCPGVCTGAIGKAEYRRTIQHIVLLFQGKKSQLLKALNREMRAAAKDERFEEAQELHRQTYALQHIHDVSLIKDEYRRVDAGKAMRIEAYDIAHLRGSANVGVMVVVEEGTPNKSQYRKFKIKAAKGGDDAGALREVLSRRLGHDEWPLPRIIAVDGAAIQVNVARTVLAEYGIGIPVVGVVKDEKHRPRNILGDRELIKDRERDILLANAEAHRFAIGFHRKKSRKELTLE